jgi:hypothetical protein
VLTGVNFDPLKKFKILTKTRNSQVFSETLEKKSEKRLCNGHKPGFAVNLMHEVEIFYIFSRRSSLLREAPK